MKVLAEGTRPSLVTRGAQLVLVITGLGSAALGWLLCSMLRARQFEDGDWYSGMDIDPVSAAEVAELNRLYVRAVLIVVVMVGAQLAAAALATHPTLARPVLLTAALAYALAALGLFALVAAGPGEMGWVYIGAAAVGAVLTWLAAVERRKVSG